MPRNFRLVAWNVFTILFQNTCHLREPYILLEPKWNTHIFELLQVKLSTQIDTEFKTTKNKSQSLTIC